MQSYAPCDVALLIVTVSFIHSNLPDSCWEIVWIKEFSTCYFCHCWTCLGDSSCLLSKFASFFSHLKMMSVHHYLQIVWPCVWLSLSLVEFWPVQPFVTLYWPWLVGFQLHSFRFALHGAVSVVVWLAQQVGSRSWNERGKGELAYTNPYCLLFVFCAGLVEWTRHEVSSFVKRSCYFPTKLKYFFQQK